MADVKAVVLYTRYRWDDGTQTHDADRGDEIEVSEAEFKRGSSFDPPALAKPGSDEAKAAQSGDRLPEQGPGLPEDLTKLSKDELLVLAKQMNVSDPEKLNKDELLAAVADAPGSRP